MKNNWGTWIVVAMIAFVLFIGYFLVLTIVDKKYDYSLVADDYYNEEIKYQNKVDMENRAVTDMVVPVLGNEGDNVVIVFPNSDSTTSGKVMFFRPSKKELDFELPIKIENGKMVIPEKLFVKGRWNVEILFSQKGKEYRKDYKYCHKCSM